MAVIADVVTSLGRSGFFAEDQAAIRAGAIHDGFDYVGAPLTPGFERIRQAGVAVSVMLVLDDGQVATGDCAAVQYSGAGGRDPVFDAARAVETIEAVVAPALRGQRSDDFRRLATQVEELRVDGAPLHSAIRYGVSQALLHAVALTSRVTMAEVVRDEYATGVELAPVRLFTQSGDDRYTNVDKMILKEAGALPHGSINHVDTKLGADGSIFAEYVGWVRDRVFALRRRADYVPVLHFDTYGTVGLAFGADTEAMADYLDRLGRIAAPLSLRIEHPVDAGSRDGQIAALSALRAALAARGSSVLLVVDEWCNTLADIQAFVAAGAADVIHIKTPDLGGIGNTIEAVLVVRAAGLEAYCGGTCNETDRSAQVTAQVAMACGATQTLAKPGMGVDEGMMVVGNEMARVIALVRARGRRKDD
jgi:methylaspartate ammonia-lyase